MLAFKALLAAFVLKEVQKRNGIAQFVFAEISCCEKLLFGNVIAELNPQVLKKLDTQTPEENFIENFCTFRIIGMPTQRTKLRSSCCKYSSAVQICWLET